MEQSGTVSLDTGDRTSGAHAEGPRQPITNTDIRQTAAGNATPLAVTRELPVPQLVAMRAQRFPRALALAMGTQTMTYDELNRRANQLAHHLQERGVGPDALVAVCLERSPTLVMALLAVLKAGGAYLPLDHHYPPLRLASTLNDAAPMILITSDALRGIFAPDFSDVCLERDAQILRAQSTADPLSAATLEHLAYVIYTSGSTGQPKGVEIIHRSLLNLVDWHQRAFAITSEDRATQLASPAFDAAVWELWPYLTAGASVHLADDATRVDALTLCEWMTAQQISVTFLPTPLAECALSLNWPEASVLRLMLTGADILHLHPPSTVPFALINNYGPTENTVVATSAPVLPNSNPAGLPPIGRPIDNVQVYVLDEALHQVPAGTPGELYLGGVGLARGYRNRPDLTAERFIPHPFAQTPQARLFRTGDAACFLADGQIAFLRRVDDEVKIRGFRIEPSEVVMALDRNRAVQASCVVAREGEDGTQQLVAYVVAQPGEGLTLDLLHADLAAQLPAYMIPAVFVQVGALPITPNGKVDRAALPAPDASNMVVPASVSDAPATSLQRRLADIVASTLGMRPDQVGLDDNFFLLGGHSMLGTQVIALVSSTFGVDLALRTLFEAPTVRELAAQVEQLLLIKIEAMSDEEVERLLR